MIKPSILHGGTYSDPSVCYKWSEVVAGSECGFLECSKMDAVSIQVVGMFSGGKLELHGSNDGVNFFPLENESGNKIYISSAGLDSVKDYVRFVKPVLVGGDVHSKLDIVIYTRGV